MRRGPKVVITKRRLGIELAKIMVLQYSNNESSISIGESVRDEDGEHIQNLDSYVGWD